MNYLFEQLPLQVSNVINNYFNIKAGDESVVCPYYINIQKRLAHPTLTGKGNPQEIEDLLNGLSSSLNFSFEKKSLDEVRKFMIKNDIGIDCSGFVARLLDILLICKTNKGLTEHFIHKKSPYRNFIYKLRPWSNMSADSLTNEKNTFKIDYHDVKPGDLIRSKGSIQGAHILFITNVERKQNELKSIQYVHSTARYGDSNGVRLGQINITSSSEPLQNQEWIDNDIDGSNPTLDGYKKFVTDNGIRRFKVLN